MQDFLVGLIVAGCAVYAAWTLMPASWRRTSAGRALGLPLPKALRARAERLTRSAPGCGCDGCDGPATPKKNPGDAQPVRFMRKPHP
jgi:hypothetical protein